MENKKIKILVIDDDEAIRETYTDIFRQSGFEVSEAVDGLEGLDKATKEIPDVIFTGIIMPRMDGFALKEALSKNVATSNIPVIIISHMGREEDRVKAEELGIKDFIVQGMVTPREVMEKIRAMFEPGEYKLKFSVNELDAAKLARDFYFNPKFECSNCRKEMILNLKISNIEKKEFIAKIICPECD